MATNTYNEVMSSDEDEWVSDEETLDPPFGSNESNKAFVPYTTAETIVKDLDLLNLLDISDCQQKYPLTKVTHFRENLATAKI